MTKFYYWLYRKKYEYAKYLPLKKPVDISLELVSGCDQACSYCYFADKKNIPFKLGVMNKDFAKSVIFEAAELGVHSIKFNFRGESTLHPNYKEIVKFSRFFVRGSTFIDRLTNSNFGFKNNVDDILDAMCTLTKVKVSFDSFRKDIIESVRVGTNYERALSNMHKFYNHPKRKDTRFVIQSVRTLLNKDEDLEHEIKKRFPSAEFSIRDMVEGRVNKDLNHLKSKDREKERQSCLQAHNRLIVHYDGRANPCCPAIDNSLIIGDLNKYTVRDVFNSDKAKNLRKSLMTGKAFEKEPCRSCSSFESYKGYKHPRDS